ncbi:sensor histidine kinase [Ruegeria halocynthiae]|uniref:sensor histidine kinase n=1 Tax=Ruegeria halocynthiae TaxID=985054 RepID=UPI000B114DA0|nr:HAMP domain-containing sensor histidine kinase [Ruegeria halocynthiae]
MRPKPPTTRFNVARRYLWGSLVAALIPLAIIAGLYDRYSANLLNNLIKNRVDANLEATAAKMSNFMAVQVNRLENIVDLPDTTAFFLSEDRDEISTLLSDILRLETENPDIYAVELSDMGGKILHTVPRSRSREEPHDYNTLPLIQQGNVQVLGPVVPRNGRPGWFLITMPVAIDQQQVGSVSLRMRLASLTEQTAALVEPNVYEPQIVVFDRLRLTAVGTQSNVVDTIASSRQFFPGWRIHLVKGRDIYQEPKTYIRYLLLVAAALSALGLIYLFHKMSERLSRHLQPLSEGARAIANGDFSVKVSEEAPGELGILARSYNRMREQLGQLIESRIDVERRAALGSMAAGIAHEIRNPLTTVSTTVHGLRRGEDDPERQEMFEVISSEIARVDTSIGEFLNYARPSEPSKDVIAVKEVLRAIKTLIATTAHERNIRVSLSGESNLRITIDQAHCRQILLNLVLNALDAMPHGGHLAMRAYRDNGDAILSVSDDGVGMDEELQSKIMRPFFTTRSNGSGLGLSVTKQLVEVNGGKLTIESEAGVGTTARVAFPYTKQLEDDMS